MHRRPRPRPEAPELAPLDPSEGAWVAAMLEAGTASLGVEFWNGHVATVVPVGNPAPYEAIARIFHPVPWHHRDWDEDAAARLRKFGLVPEDHADFRDAPRSEHRTLHAYGTTTWSQVATERGTAFHAGAQWADLARAEENESVPSTREARLEYGSPDQGQLSSPAMARLAEVLLGHTETPQDLVLGLWPGRGWIDGGSSRFGPGVLEATGGKASSVRMPPAFGPRTTRALRRGSALLQVGGGFREYLLLADDGTRLRHPVWERAAHRLLPEEEPTEEQSPNLAWPRDRAWALASEIDLDSTLVAGSTELIRAICTHPGLEAAVVRPETDLTAFADTLNHRDLTA
ncbi:hypothetical protein AB0333_14885 [Citricoccus sp. NPDC079358]|uniref:hypothetical protein n=1 Tax=Citricoccus sp. NPDC079358 TaxID=3154653 RepID=UPI00344C0B7C